MMDPIDTFERSNRNRARIIKAVVILIPVAIFGVLGKSCYTQETKRRAHNRQVQSDYELRAEKQRLEVEAEEKWDVDRRTKQLEGRREELDALLAEAATLREVGRTAFVEGVARASVTPDSCGAISRATIASWMALPQAAKDRVFAGADISMMDIMSQSKGGYVLTPALREPLGQVLNVNFALPDANLRSIVLEQGALGEQAARAEVQRGLYPEDLLWARPQGLELVLRLDAFQMPDLPYGFDSPFDEVKEFTGGVATGRAILWSHNDQRVVCAGDFSASSSNSIVDVEQTYASIGGTLQPGSSGNRVVVLYALAVDFEQRVTSAVADALKF